jgi:hypothetical protein
MCIAERKNSEKGVSNNPSRKYIRTMLLAVFYNRLPVTPSDRSEHNRIHAEVQNDAVSTDLIGQRRFKGAVTTR